MPTMIAPQMTPRTRAHTVSTSHASTGPTTATWCTASLRWWTSSSGAVNPSSAVPTRMMCPPTHSMANMPTMEITLRTDGMARTRNSPKRWDFSESRLAMARPMSSIFTIRATTP